MARILISPGRYIQGKGELSRIAEHTKSFGSHPLIIASQSGLKRIRTQIEQSYVQCKQPITPAFAAFGGECCDEEINRLVQNARDNACDYLVGCGGGKTLDAVKAAAHLLSCPVVICPTIASTDAPCSALAVIYTPQGQFDRYWFFPKNPDAVLVDTAIIANAPVRLLVSGMGDALATFFEARACVASGASTCAGGSATAAAYAVARLCYETLLSDGKKAKEALSAGACTQAVENIIEANTLLSGLGFESCGLAAAHAIHDGLTMLPQCHHLYHGEKVAFGTLTQLVLENADESEIHAVLSFCRSVGLPTTFADLGLQGVTREELMRVAEAACAPTDTMGNMPFPVTAEMVADALLAADAIARAL